MNPLIIYSLLYFVTFLFVMDIGTVSVQMKLTMDSV